MPARDDADCRAIDGPNPTDYHSVPAEWLARDKVPEGTIWFARFAEQTSLDFPK
jgi:hypothetical protein